MCQVQLSASPHLILLKTKLGSRYYYFYYLINEEIEGSERWRDLPNDTQIWSGGVWQLRMLIKKKNSFNT